MIDYRRLTPIGCLLVTAALAIAQTAAPPAPPQPAQPARPAAAPRPAAPRLAPLAPMPPMPALAPEARPMLAGDLDDDISEQAREMAEQAREIAEQAREKAAEDREQTRGMSQQINEQVREQTRELAQQAREMARKQVGEMDIETKIAGLKFKFDGMIPPAAFAQEKLLYASRGGDSGLYQRGQNDIENHRWDQALEDFSQVAARGGTRADGALYWKAYTLNKLGRRDEAMAAIAELRKSYSGSRWLDDAKALEVEIKQSSGQKVSPESESDEELKLLALNGLMQSDPERALPAVETLMKSGQSPRVKQHALFVLAQNSSPRAQQLLEQVARGGGNPDLQLSAIRYIGETRRKQGTAGQLLAEVYAASNDVNVKRAIINSLASGRDKDRLLQIAKTEKAADLRMEAIQSLGSGSDQAELWQLYQAETSPEVKQQILSLMSRGANIDKLLEVARADKDVKLRRSAIRSLGSIKAAAAGDALVAMYANEPDPQVKRTIIDTLCGQNNVKGLVVLARNEKDGQMRRDLVNRLAGMHSKEAEDYLLELLNK